MKEYLLRFNKYPKLGETLQTIAESKSSSFNEILNDGLMEWLIFRWQKMNENIDYFRKLEKRLSFLFSNPGAVAFGKFLQIVFFISPILLFLSLFGNLFLPFLDLTILQYIATVSFLVFILNFIPVLYVRYFQEKASIVNIQHKAKKYGLKLSSIILPENANYNIYHSENGDLYLVEYEGKEDLPVKIPSNTEALTIPINPYEKIVMAIQK